MTHGHELSRGNAGGRGCRAEGNKGGEYDNCNSIINKIYILKRITVLAENLNYYVY